MLCYGVAMNEVLKGLQVKISAWTRARLSARRALAYINHQMSAMLLIYVSNVARFAFTDLVQISRSAVPQTAPSFMKKKKVQDKDLN